MTAAEGRAAVEWNWLTTPTATVLHHATLNTEDAEEMADGSLEDPVAVTATCGRPLVQPLIPGPFTRMGIPRCQRCCDRLGYHHGKGSPKNDESLRPLVEARLAAVAGPAMTVALSPAQERSVGLVLELAKARIRIAALEVELAAALVEQGREYLGQWAASEAGL